MTWLWLWWGCVWGIQWARGLGVIWGGIWGPSRGVEEKWHTDTGARRGCHDLRQCYQLIAHCSSAQHLHAIIWYGACSALIYALLYSGHPTKWYSSQTCKSPLDGHAWRKKWPASKVFLFHNGYLTERFFANTFIKPSEGIQTYFHIVILDNCFIFGIITALGVLKGEGF